jgi:hypothetical protein
MAEKTTNQNLGNQISECVSLLDKAFDGLITRSLTEEPFSSDLTESVVPTINALKSAKQTYISHLREHVKVSGKEAKSMLDEHVKATGSIDMLNAAIAAGKGTTEGAATKTIEFANGVKRIPWLELIKEIINLIIDILPIPIPDWLKKVIQELLKIIDKIFGGMPHEDLATQG